VNPKNWAYANDTERKIQAKIAELASSIYSRHDIDAAASIMDPRFVA
jgi:hypothetical protein